MTLEKMLHDGAFRLTWETLESQVSQVNRSIKEPVTFGLQYLGKVANDNYAETWVHLTVSTPRHDPSPFWTGPMTRAFEVAQILNASYMITSSWQK